MNAYRLLEQNILKRYRLDHMEHGACLGLHIVEAVANNGLLGDGTDGCAYVRFTATIACGGQCEAPGPVQYSFGEFGDLAILIEELERQQNEADGSQRD